MMLWAFLAVQAAGFVLGLVAGAFDKPEWTEDILLAGTVTNAVMLIAYVVYTRKRSIPFSESTVTRKFSWWLVPVGIVATVALQYCTTGVLTLVDKGLSALGYTSVNSVVNTDFGARGALGYVGYAVVTCLVTGFTEELIFRGAILSGFRTRFGTVGAIVLSGAVFSIFHCSPDQTLFQFAFGCVLALLTVRSGSVVPAMVCHACNNALSIAYTELGFSYPMPSGTGALVCVAIVGVLLAATVLPLLINAASGCAKKTWWLTLILRKKRTQTALSAAECVESPVQNEPVTENDCAPEATAESAPEATEAKQKHSSAWLILACVACAALWISQLVLGFLTH